MHNLFSASGNLSKGVTLGLTSADGRSCKQAREGQLWRRRMGEGRQSATRPAPRGGRGNSSLADGSCRLSLCRPKLVSLPLLSPHSQPSLSICLSPSLLGISKSFCLPTFHNENAVALRSVGVLELLLLLLLQLLNN